MTLLLLLAGCVGPWPDGQYSLAFTPDDLHLGFVHPSPVDDGGWAATHHEGALAAAEHFGATLDYRPLVANIDAGSTIDELIELGANVVYTPSSGYIQASLDGAANHPDEYIFSCCGQVTAENLKSYFARMYQPLYLAGYAAAGQTCTGTLGVVSAFPDAEFIRHANAFTLGAQKRAAEDGRQVQVRIEYIYAY
ncbi:MAG: BMP family ABC transporter substrate-binding protein [Alphaproteobacteria bacterium]|nr:BMP family ABC transporter substrate-binding protein [Alphaproteobacteria bacterium]